MPPDDKKQLVDLLDRSVFRPVMSASPDRYEDPDRAKLERVQRSTESERERYQNYPNAAKVRQMFHDDLTSEPAKRIQRLSRELGLPTLPDVKDEFDELCNRLGVGRS